MALLPRLTEKRAVFTTSFGLEDQAITHAIFAAGRDVHIELVTLDTGRLSSIRNDALEVTLSIVPGESGAPVFIARTGEVVGVADSRFDDERSIGFAVPIDDARKFLRRYDRGHGF